MGTPMTRKRPWRWSALANALPWAFITGMCAGGYFATGEAGWLIGAVMGFVTTSQSAIMPGTRRSWFRSGWAQGFLEAYTSHIEIHNGKIPAIYLRGTTHPDSDVVPEPWDHDDFRATFTARGAPTVLKDKDDDFGAGP